MHDLPESTREKLVEMLNQRLADAIDLMLQAKQAHWNVKGRHFIALHELFDDVYESLSEHVDLLAERAAQLGGAVEGTIRSAATRSSLDEYPAGLVAGPAHVDALTRVLAQFGAAVRREIDFAADLRDADTADILTEISRAIDKHLWFVGAHAHGD